MRLWFDLAPAVGDPDAARTMAGGYDLVQLKNGTWSVRSLAEGETFHPVVGPVAEAEALYVRQLNLAERAHQAEEGPLILWDVGLGAAANVLTALRALVPTGRALTVLSFDHTLEPLRFAFERREQLGYFGGFEAVVETLLHEGQVRCAEAPLPLDWRVLTTDFPTLLTSPEAEHWPAPHGILFDAFSPAKNPAMWTLPLFTRLRQLTRPDRPCSLATYSRATLLRVTLLRAGWFVGVGHATGEKDETTVAANVPELITEPLGQNWLERARRSTSAEPLTAAEYRQRPLSPESGEALNQHPQFRLA